MSLAPQVYVQDENGRKKIASLRPCLSSVAAYGEKMDPSRIKNLDGQYCRWAGFLFAKGVTNAMAVEPVSVLSLHSEMPPTLHGQLIQGFPEVDEYPWCYHSDKGPGFGGFVRWAYFCDPANVQDIVAIDFDPEASPFIGKARDYFFVAALARALLLHGMRDCTELVLANPEMLENFDNYLYRKTHQLWTLLDWSQKCRSSTSKKGSNLPGCNCRIWNMIMGGGFQETPPLTSLDMPL